MEVTALEIIAIAAREGTFRDPRNPRGTRGGLTYCDICFALGAGYDQWGADMALMIGTRDVRNADKAKVVLERYVRSELARQGQKTDAAKVAIAVERAISDAVYSGARDVGESAGSKMYRLAMQHLVSRAEAAADEAIRRRLAVKAVA